MKQHYDFSDSIQNPYCHMLHNQELVSIDAETIAYFKARAAETGNSYQKMINQLLASYVSCQTVQTPMNEFERR